MLRVWMNCSLMKQWLVILFALDALRVSGAKASGKTVSVFDVAQVNTSLPPTSLPQYTF
jgi:hypothetical protein